MIALPRAAIKRLRALSRRGVPPGQSRSPTYPVRISAQDGVAVLAVHLGDVVVALNVPDIEGTLDSLILSMADLERFTGSGSDRVNFEVLSEKRGRATWKVRDIPASREFDLAESELTWPDVPTEWMPIPATFLQALHEAGRSTASDRAKYAMDWIQIRGQTGQLIASDTKQVLVQGGFTFPFEENLLLPAVPIFAAKELLRQSVSIGFTTPWLCVDVGPWRIWLQHNPDLRYPDVFEVVPKALRSQVMFHERDVETILEVLAMPLPTGATSRPVTIDLGEQVYVRIRPDETDEILEAPLPSSRRVGTDVQLVVDSELLGRGLSLGFREFRISAGHRPIYSLDPNRMYLCITGDPATALPAPLDRPETVEPASRPAMAALEGSPAVVVMSSSPSPQRSFAVLDREPARVANGPVNLTADGTIDPLTEAEALRVALTDAAGRIGRLIAYLKQFGSGPRIVAAASSGLRQLNLSP